MKKNARKELIEEWMLQYLIGSISLNELVDRIHSLYCKMFRKYVICFILIIVLVKLL
jgi:hypothetical protein